MKSNKSFDAVKMKNDIQEQLLKEQKGKNDFQIRASIQNKLEVSKNPVALFWRKIQKENIRKAA